MNNKVITTQGNVQFQFPDGKIVNVHPNHIYTAFNEDTVSFILVGLPKTSGLSTMTSKAEDLELNGTVYSFAELPNAVSEAFAIAGAQARCEIVDELPETGYTNTIYLVPQPAPQTGFDEYVYILDQGWELIGDTSIEMNNYVLKTVFSGYTADTAVVLNGLRTDVDTTSGNVITETERALLAESGLSDAIVAEIARAENAESGLSDAIVAEEAAREAADGVISGAVDTVSSGLTQEVQRAQNAESGLSDAIDAEETRALAAEDALDGKIDAVSAATDAALANKQNTLIAGENITISSTTSGDVISAEGGTIVIDPTLDSGSTNAVANSAITNAINSKQDSSKLPTYIVKNVTFTKNNVSVGIADKSSGGQFNNISHVITINNQAIFNNSDLTNLSLVETSAITTSVTSASTDSQVPSAKAMYDELAAIDVKFIDDAKYELSGTTHVINFYNGDVVKATIDASDFIVDGMVDNVYIENGYLVIDFNTESGKEDIQIPLTDIFNPNNYYTKSETSGATELSTEFATKLNTADFNTYSGSVDTRLAEDEEVTSRALNALNETVSGKADSDDVYLKSETSGATEISTALSNKLDATAYTPTDLSNYYTKSETSGATEIATALSDKQDTLSAGTNITISGNVISAEGGGGKAIEAGRGISITTGETADTISFNLPISAGTGSNTVIMGGTSTANGSNSLVVGSNNELYSGSRNLVVGYNCKRSGDGGAVIGWNSESSGDFAVAFGDNNFAAFGSLAQGRYNKASGTTSFALGNSSSAYSTSSFALGEFIEAKNFGEHSIGRYNVSNKANNAWGDSGNTIFSVGNGTSYMSGYDVRRHNAIEIRQNGDIYIADTNDTSTSNYYEKPMVKLQDALGGSSYTAGDGIDITSDVISVTGKVSTSDFNTYSGSVDTELSGKASQSDLSTLSGQVTANTTAIASKVDTSAVTSSITSGSTDVVTSGGVYEALGGMKIVKLTESEYAALATKDSNVLYVVIPDPTNP